MGLFESRVQLKSITIMVQKDVADRMQVGPGTKDYGALSLAVQYYATVSYTHLDQAPVEDTLRWFTDVDTVFRQFGIGCAVWTYKDMDFGLMGEHYAPIREQLLTLWNRK